MKIRVTFVALLLLLTIADRASAQGLFEAGAVRGGPNTSTIDGTANSFNRLVSSAGKSGNNSRKRSYMTPTQAAAYGGLANHYFLAANQKSSIGNFSAAEALYDKSLTIRENIWGARDPATQKILQLKATICKNQGRLETEEKCLRKILGFIGRTHGPGSPESREVVLQLIECCAGQGKYQQAVELSKQLVALRDRYPDPLDPNSLKARLILAQMLSCTNSGEASDEAWLNAVNIADARDHRTRISVLTQYHSFLVQQHMLSKAAGIEARLQELNSKHL